MFQIHLDDHARHRLGVTANQCDFVVRQRFGVFTKQLPAARERNRFEPRIRTIDELHGALRERESRDFVLFWVARSSAPASQANALEVNRTDVGGVPTSIRQSDVRSVRHGCGESRQPSIW
jgi:hypothetical protein